ncbi:MAG: insulinase family protein [Parcubacteria group bacterium]|nr:insulinase family protein [Parcubacteria group bacterium]
MSDYKVRRTIRDDGLTVVTCELPHKNSVRLGVAARVGSANDPDDKEGLFHFFEHMAFKGTTTKPQVVISSLLDRLFVNGSANAYTAELCTVYGGEAYHARLGEVADLVFDMFANPSFPPDEIEREKNVVENELLMHADQATSRAIDALNEALWKRNPQRRFGCGSRETLASINRELLSKTHQSFYVPSNTIVVCSGKVDHDFLVDKAFMTFPENERSVPQMRWDDELSSSPEEKELAVHLPREQTVILIGGKMPTPSDKEKVALDILMKMLANGFNSILFQELREKRGLCYGVWGMFNGYRRLGYSIGFMSETRHEHAPQAHDLMREIVCRYPLSSRESFSFAKEALRDSLLVFVDNVGGWEKRILDALIDKGTNEHFLNAFFTERQHLVDELTFDDVIAVREKFINPERLVSVIVKP